MKALGGIVLSIVLLLQTAAGASAQAPRLEIASITTQDRATTVTVVAPPILRGGIVAGAGFTVEIGGVEVEPTVEPVRGEELDVVLLVDTSGSMTREALDAAKDAGTAFVRQLPPGARIGVIGFGDEVAIVQGFTTDHDAVIAQLDVLEAQGETALYDAVEQAVAQFDPATDSTRTIVLLSDGGNTVDVGTLEGAQRALERSEATLYAVSIDTAEANPGELEALAERSGGSIARVDQVDALAAVYDEIAQALGNQYRLSFDAVGEGLVEAHISAVLGDLVIAETTVRLTLPRLPAVPAGEPAPAPPSSDASPLPEPPPPPSATVESPVTTTPASAVVTAADSPLLKWGAIGSIALALVTAALVVLLPDERRSRHRVRPAERFAGKASSAQRGAVLGAIARLTAWIEHRLRGRRMGAWLSGTLDTAGWKVRNGEFLLLVGLAAVVAFFGGGISSVGFGIALVVLVITAVVGTLSLLARKRRDAFADQLNSTFQMMAGGLRTGYSLPQVVAMVAQESEAPTSEEFGRIVVESRLGRDLVQATLDVAHRMRSEDLAWATGAIDITRDVGGDLAEVLDNVADTIRTRARVRNQIKALSAEGRVSAWILLALPIPIFCWQLVVNRDYTLLLFTDRLGRMIFVSAVCALAGGAFWMRRLLQVRY